MRTASQTRAVCIGPEATPTPLPPAADHGKLGATVLESANAGGSPLFQGKPGLALAALAALLPMSAAFGDEPPRALRSCVACHTFDKGGHSKIGPNLWGIAGAKALHDPNYDKYGDDFRAAAAAGLVWTDANLDAYIAEPVGFLRDAIGKRAVRTYMVTRMPREADRAAILDYLKSLKDE